MRNKGKTHKVEIGSFDKVIIDKLFGPTAFCTLIIEQDFDTYEWVVKKEFIRQNEGENDYVELVEMCRINADWE